MSDRSVQKELQQGRLVASIINYEVFLLIEKKSKNKAPEVNYSAIRDWKKVTNRRENSPGFNFVVVPLLLICLELRRAGLPHRAAESAGDSEVWVSGGYSEWLRRFGASHVRLAGRFSPSRRGPSLLAAFRRSGRASGECAL